MAKLSSFSSSYKSEVDQILAEAMDDIVLDQVAAINCSSFTDSVLPPHIETRFRKLKTFPSSNTRLGPDSAAESGDSVGGHRQLSPESKRSSVDGEGKMVISPSGDTKVSNFGKNSVDAKGKVVISPHGQSKVSNFENNSDDDEGKMVNSPTGQSKVSNFVKNSDDVEGKMVNSPHGQVKVSNFERCSSGGKGKKVNSSSGYSKVPKFERCSSGGGKGKKVNSQGGYVSSPSDSSSRSIDSPNLYVKKHSVRGKMVNSQPRSDSEEEIESKSSSGCLCFSPKRVSKKKKNGSGGRVGSGGRLGSGELGFGWGRDEELLSDLRSFSTKEQKRRMKEAVKEEEKIIKEAEKIVEWAKQVSARIDFDISDDDLDDDDGTLGYGHK